MIDYYSVHGNELSLSISVHHYCILGVPIAIVSRFLIFFWIAAELFGIVLVFKGGVCENSIIGNDNVKVESLWLWSRVKLAHVWNWVHPYHLWSRLNLQHLGGSQLNRRKNSFKGVSGCLLVMLGKCCVIQDFMDWWWFKKVCLIGQC